MKKSKEKKASRNDAKAQRRAICFASLRETSSSCLGDQDARAPTVFTKMGTAEFFTFLQQLWDNTNLSSRAFSSMVKKTVPFEESLAELEQLVERMEQGNLALEESLKLFERGVQLTRTCQKALKEAEQKVQILLETNAEPTLQPFTDES